MLLRAENIEQHYGSAQVLRRVSFEIAQGECLAVLGRNGAGKTSLLKSLMGVLPLSGGAIFIDGKDISALSSGQRSRLGMAYVPQGREIFSELSIAENIEVAARAHRTDAAIVEETLALFPILKQMWRRPGGALSGGQQQQLAIARALITKPSLLILDEPTEGIQPNIVTAIKQVLASFKGRLSILLVEQYLDFALELADAVVVLSRGAVVQACRSDMTSRDELSRHIAI